jgi:hypothetical protein
MSSEHQQTFAVSTNVWLLPPTYGCCRQSPSAGRMSSKSWYSRVLMWLATKCAGGVPEAGAVGMAVGFFGFMGA